MNYSETLDYLYARLPLFSRVGAAALKPDLTNIIVLLRELGDPHQQLRTVHVAGTNGKGSVSHMLAAIFQEAGYRTGLYTSPHLKDFRERIRINGDMISEDFVTRFTERIRPAIERLSPSFFEITVAMAFDYFAEQQIDIAIIETGLGGRLDSTNVIRPELSVITQIGMDHTNLLGDTLEQIAKEKAGIIKEKVPVVIGETTPVTRAVFVQAAADRQAPIYFATEERQAMEWKWEKHELVVSVAEKHKTDHLVYHLDLAGLYQVKNLLTVLAAVARLEALGWTIYPQQVQQALRQVKKLTGLHGRWELVQEHPAIILDVAHNEDGIRQVTGQLELSTYDRLHIVIGMVKDKEIDKVLPLLPFSAVYYFTQSSIPRALPAGELQALAAAYNLQGKTYPDVNKALAAAKEKAGKKDMILVCGSVFLVGEIEHR